jgi:proteasome lid subunit RPN8/RPN11
VSAPSRQRHLAELVRTLRENGRLLAMLARWYEADRLTPPAHGGTFHQPADIAAYLGAEMADLPQEQLRVVLLDRRGRLIDTPLVYQGGQSETAVRLADCFREAVRRSAAAIVLVHNHPSGDPSPSSDDVRLTHDAGQAGLLLGISVLDQIILAHDGFVSLRAEGLYSPPDDDSVSEPAAPVEMAPALRWGYDCARCGARVRGLDGSRLTCQRCLAPVASRMIQTARELPVPELTGPAAA